MSAQKIAAKQYNYHQPVMGKGNYIRVQTNRGKQAENPLLPTFSNHEGKAQLATNYLLSATVSLCKAPVNKQ